MAADLGLHVTRIRRVSKADAHGLGARHWHVWTADNRRLVLRRAAWVRTVPEVEYERRVLRHLSRLGWKVPRPVGGIHLDSRARVWTCATHVGGRRWGDSGKEQRARGVLLARLHAALGELTQVAGQRPGWAAEPDLERSPAMTAWNQGLEALAGIQPDLVRPIREALGRVRGELHDIDMSAWPRTIVHGDFTTSNLRRPAGVIDFDLCHLGTRPWEFAIARCQRSPLVIDGYRDEALRLGFPLSREEEAGVPPCYRGLKVLMIATELHTGLVSGHFDIPMIETQLEKTTFGL